MTRELGGADQTVRNRVEGGVYRATMHAACGALVARLGGGNVLGAGLTSKLGGVLNDLSDEIRSRRPTGNADIDQALGQIVATGVGTAVGAVVGGSSGAFTGFNADRFNRQLHTEEKSLAKKIANDAQAKGIRNSDGSPITTAQIENAMRSANNNERSETITTGMVVPLNEDTTTNQIYDANGMRVISDGAGNQYLVQDPSMFTSPSDALRNLIKQNSGGASSPYSWNSLSPEAAQASSTPTFPTSPFAPGWNTGENSAGLSEAGRGVTPDYATIGSGSLSASGSVLVNLHDGTVYLAGGVTQSNPGSISIKPGAVASIGWIFNAGSASSVNGFLTGAGNQGYVSIPTPFDANVYFGISHSYGGSTALELGIATPGKISFGISPFSQSTPVLNQKGK
ncbi:MAG: polymorphic toxin type 22 domain-containing protein [Formivibrio sp.]|nr:polymorphic toxin type 22 domain-containing protein [Formivibrio sp.]